MQKSQENKQLNLKTKKKWIEIKIIELQIEKLQHKVTSNTIQATLIK